MIVLGFDGLGNRDEHGRSGTDQGVSGGDIQNIKKLGRPEYNNNIVSLLKRVRFLIILLLFLDKRGSSSFDAGSGSANGMAGIRSCQISELSDQV